MVFGEEMVTERLSQLGYPVKETDAAAVSWAVGKVRERIRAECNVTEVPEGMTFAAADMAVGEFLTQKKTFAPDDLAGFDFSAAVKQIELGDTNTVFAVGDGSMTEEQRLDAFLACLLDAGKPLFAAFRRLTW